MISTDDLRAFHTIKQDLLREIYPNRRWGSNLSIRDFMVGMSVLNPQAYGNRIETRIGEHFGLSKSKDKNKGDYISKLGHPYEIKASILSRYGNKHLNMVQIRPWQNVSYIFVVFDIENYNNSLVFMLTNQEMHKELDLLKATAAHGTKEANKDNDKVELRMGLLADRSNQHCKRWLSSYSVDLEILDLP